jgi:hypothetical protein
MRAHRLEDSHSEFEQAVFRAAYDSALQRRRRGAAFFLLMLKHSARGLFFSWPVYVLVLAVAFGDSFYALAYLLLLIPALALSMHILVRGAWPVVKKRIRAPIAVCARAALTLFETRIQI